MGREAEVIDSERKYEGNPMRILMLGNSLTFANDMPSMLAKITGAEVVHHTRGGARLAEQLNPKTQMGEKTRAALENDSWDYVILQDMSNGPITARKTFLANSERLCKKIKAAGAKPIFFATWAYRRGSEDLERLHSLPPPPGRLPPAAQP